MTFDTTALQWTREPAQYTIAPDCITIVTEPHTDLWQRTYYGFRNDNAPVLQLTTPEQYFSFVVKTEFTQIGKNIKRAVGHEGFDADTV